MAISKDLKDKAQKTREDGVFTLKLDEGVSLAMLVSFASGYVPRGERRRHRHLAGGRWRAGGLGARWRNRCLELKGNSRAPQMRRDCAMGCAPGASNLCP